MTAAVARRFPPQHEDVEPASLNVEDLKTLIEALPTRADIEALISKVE